MSGRGSASPARGGARIAERKRGGKGAARGGGGRDGAPAGDLMENRNEFHRYVGDAGKDSTKLDPYTVLIAVAVFVGVVVVAHLVTKATAVFS